MVGAPHHVTRQGNTRPFILAENAGRAAYLDRLHRQAKLRLSAMSYTGGLFTSPIMNKPALISLTFDDGLRCQFEKAVPILAQYGFPATFFIISNRQPNHEDRWPKIEWHEQDILMLKEVARQGHEIASHTVNHCPPTMQNQEAHESKRLIAEWMGGLEIPSFAYPFYNISQPIRNAVINAGYKQARWGGSNSFIPRGFHDWFAIDCRTISNNENVGGWLQPDCWHVLTFHGIGTDQDGWQPITVAEFARQMAELAKLRDSSAVEVVTFKDGADRLRQP
jgi:peptidoglycan/xylan/chitin deacetylase (PgdA/CDA1 family)